MSRARAGAASDRARPGAGGGTGRAGRERRAGGALGPDGNRLQLGAAPRWRSLAFLILAALLAPGPAAWAADTLRVVFTAETRGNLLPCSCPTHPLGGLARRAGFLKSFARAERGRFLGPDANGTTLVLDAGGFLPEGQVPLRDDPKVKARFVRLLLHGMEAAGVQAVALDYRERGFLSDLAPAEMRRLGPALLDADPPSRPRVLRWGERKVAVLALEESLADSVVIRAGCQARAGADYLIVLARADCFTGRRLARLARADLVLLSRGARPGEPLHEGRSILVGCGMDGREAGEILLVSQDAGGLATAHFTLHAMDDTVPRNLGLESEVLALTRDAGPDGLNLAGARE